MNADDLKNVLTYIFVASGVPKSSIFARWGVFAYPFWQNAAGSEVGFKVMAYIGVDSSKTRIAKMCLSHGLTCLTAGLGAGTSGLGSLGSGIETATGKYGGLKNAFDVDIGAVQLSAILESGDSSPLDIANAIIASGKMLYYAVVRVDRAEVGYRLHVRGETSPTSYSEWSRTHIKTMHTNATHYTIWPNGIVHKGVTTIGNFKTGKTL